MGKKYEEKSGQWFGAVVQSSGADGTVLVNSFLLLQEFSIAKFLSQIDPLH